MSFLLLLLTVAFFTLFERKIMGSFHQRLGPVKLSFTGVLQPLLDALKLFLKNPFKPNMSNYQFYSYAPVFALYLSGIIMMLLPSFYKSIASGYSFVIFLCLSSISVFVLLFSGWASNSKYTLMGALRGIAQSISYEAVLSTLMLMLMSILGTYSIETLSLKTSVFILYLFPLWLICLLGETHRAPFDFSEAESELVSGFNTEYSGQKFAFLFLSEYVMILFGSMLVSYLFILGPLDIFNYLSASLCTILVTYFITWVRITFCRSRYDQLMDLAWKILLPIVLGLYLLFFWLI